MRKNTDNAMNVEKVTLVISLMMMYVKGTCGIGGCPSPQYVEFGSKGIVKCDFQENLFAVYWYNTTDVRQSDAIVILQESVKSGKGFVSGLFDVCPNGSLIINNVTYNNEGTFVVVKVETPSTRPTRDDINVFVIEKTFSRIPLIAGCDEKGKLCLHDLAHHGEVMCCVKDARSLIPLTWNVRTIDEDLDLNFIFTVKNTTKVYTYCVTTKESFSFSPLLTLLVCKADITPGVIDRNESLVLLKRENPDLTSEKIEILELEMDKQLRLNCSSIRISYLVWQFKNRFQEKFETILYAAFDEVHYVHKNEEYVLLENTGTLVVNLIRVKHEGVYSCIGGNGKQDAITLYEVFVHVTPTPAHPIVQGCTHEQYCVLQVENEGNIECKVDNVRPLITLDIKTVSDKSSQEIQFFDKERSIDNKGDVFDISIITKYKVTNPSSSRITIECIVIEELHPQLDPSTKFDLLLLTGAAQTTQPFPGRILFWLIIILSVVTFVFLPLGVCVMRASWKRRVRTDAKRLEEESIPLNTTGVSILEKKALKEKENLLITQLKSRYSNLYDAVLPIPYIRDMLYSVDGIFVEGGVEHLDQTSRRDGEMKWIVLNSYQNILNDKINKSGVRFVEGEPGYGKTMLTLKFAYDWCNKTEASPLSNVNILILLRLRQLGDIQSIYTAIRLLLLPKDTILTEKDIEDILRDNPSVVFILDGFDEFSIPYNENSFDIVDIIAKEMFNQTETILTTRSSCLPKNYPPKTERFRLTGFDCRSRDEYIFKAVVGGNEAVAGKIKRRLKDNPVLAGVCQIPLFFVMFAHMSHMNQHHQRFTSVTSFFRYMIACFHSHMENKTRDVNVTAYDSTTLPHGELNKAAFEGLITERPHIQWKKLELNKRLGQELYDKCVRIGVLVEDDVLCMDGEHIFYETKVRFYHKIFCEWYAAHHLVKMLSSEDVISEVNVDLFEVDKPYWDNGWDTDKYVSEDINPFGVQYLYRFCCGINSAAGQRIIKSLQKNEAYEKFTILCILEQEGDIRTVIPTVKRLCSSAIEIKAGDNILLQESCVEMLKIAAQHEITISCVHLAYRCFRFVDVNEESLHLVSGVQLPTLETLQKLEIHDDGDIRNEAKDILNFMAKCNSLTVLTFTSGYPPIILPEMIRKEDIPSDLLKRGCKVQWKYRLLEDGDKIYLWLLNLKTGKWEDSDGRKMSNEDYWKAVESTSFESDDKTNEENTGLIDDT